MSELQRQTKIVTWSWQEPQQGTGDMCVALTPIEWQEYQAAVDWIEEYWEGYGELGDTIAETKIHETKGVSAPTALHDALQDLAVNVQYSSGEDLYDEDCQIFAKHGVDRS